MKTMQYPHLYFFNSMFHLFHHIFFPKTSDRPQILPALGPVSPAAERTDPGGGLLLRTVHRAVGVQGHGGVGIGHLQGWKNMGKMGGKWEGLEGLEAHVFTVFCDF
jgi:hypothetical protein